jgi:hypothetical protein
MWKTLVIVAVLALSSSICAQDIDFIYQVTDKSTNFIDSEISANLIMPNRFISIDIELEELKNQLGYYVSKSIRSKSNAPSRKKIILPTPEGKEIEFVIEETMLADATVEHLYSAMTFKGYKFDEPHIHMRMSVSSHGFHVFVFDKDQSFTIEPSSKDDKSKHMVFYKKDLDFAGVKCLYRKEDFDPQRRVQGFGSNRTPNQKRTYRLAMIADNTYRAEHGGASYDPQNILDHFLIGINLLNGVYERDLGVSFLLVSNEDCANAILDDHTDIDEVHDYIVWALGVDGFDVGHSLLWANTGGVAYLGVVCWDLLKGGGFSGANQSVTTLYIDYCAHEIGHQLFAEHTFVSAECGQSAEDNRYEPGEGSTIMAYAGICGNGYQNNSDPYFHSRSLEEMHAYIANTSPGYGGSCGTTDNTGNASAPVVNAHSNITIPKETPFILVGTGSDADGDPIDFSWEQYDGLSEAVSGTPDCSSENAPLFRFRIPMEQNYRIFPEMGEILTGNNNNATWEALPCDEREINFRLTVRDNNAEWGRTDYDNMLITVADTGPFDVLYPNGGEFLYANSEIEVSWTVNGTDAHCPEVNIFISTDNGQNFSPIGNTYPNNGSALVILPASASSQARLLVQCAEAVSELRQNQEQGFRSTPDFGSASTFFDVSDASFEIASFLPVEWLSFTSGQSNQKIILNWQTASEFNNKGFEVLRSSDAKNWNNIGFVEAKSTSATVESYHFVDPQALPGLNYYRLKQIDYDGLFSYSRVLSEYVEENDFELKIFPNPAADAIFIMTNSNEQNTQAQISLYELTGRLVRQQILILYGNSQSTQINLEDLTSGIYMLEITTENSNLKEKLVIKR